MQNEANSKGTLCWPSLSDRSSISRALTHAVTTRHGGVSTGPYASNNLGLHVGDSVEAVMENRRRVCQAAGVELDSVVAGAQVLGNAVAWVTEADRGRGARDQASRSPTRTLWSRIHPGLC